MANNQQEQYNQYPQEPFQHQHRFRVNPKPSYSERMTTTRGALRAFVRERLGSQQFLFPRPRWLDPAPLVLTFLPTAEITREPTAQMRWAHGAYIKDIVGRYRVRIEGWPLDEVPFKNLSEVPNLGKLELLLARWKEGRIYFRGISEAEYAEMLRDPSPWIGAESAGESAEVDGEGS